MTSPYNTSECLTINYRMYDESCARYCKKMDVRRRTTTMLVSLFFSVLAMLQIIKEH